MISSRGAIESNDANNSSKRSNHCDVNNSNISRTACKKRLSTTVQATEGKHWVARIQATPGIQVGQQQQKPCNRIVDSSIAKTTQRSTARRLQKQVCLSDRRKANKRFFQWSQQNSHACVPLTLFQLCSAVANFSGIFPTLLYLYMSYYCLLSL